ncbi:Putative RING-H2 finger protein ATL53 [Linum grandiflorum]
MDDTQQLDNPTTPSSPSSSSSSASAVITPLLISAAGVTATFLIIFTYHILVTRCCSRRRLQAAGSSGGGVREKVMKGIPAVLLDKGGLTAAATSDGKKVNDDCVICIGKLEEGETVRFMPRCGHVFHASCVDRWLLAHSSCPTCRAPIVLPCDDVAASRC